MGAIPIIAAAVSIAGTAASVSAQQSSVRAQNRAIDSQISANEDYEKIRLMNARAQRQIINQQAEIAKNAISQNAQAERMQLINQRAGLMSQLAQQTQMQQLELSQMRNAVGAEQSNLETARQDTARANMAAVGQGIAQAAEVVSQLPDPTQDIKQLKDEVDARALQVQAYTGTRGRTSQLQAKLTPDQVNMVAEALMQQRGIGAAAAKAIASSTAFAKIATQMANEQITQQQVALNSGQRQAQTQAGFERRLGRQQTNTATTQIDLALEQNTMSKKLNLADNRTNRLFALGSLVTGQGLGAAQSAASVAQANSQRQSGPSLLGQLAAYGSALTPLMGQLQGTPTSRYPSLSGAGANPGVMGGSVGAGFGVMNRGGTPPGPNGFLAAFLNSSQLGATQIPTQSTKNFSTVPGYSRTLNFGGS